MAAAENVNAPAAENSGNQAINNEGLIDANVIAATAENFGNQAIDNEGLIDVNVNAATAVENLGNQAIDIEGLIDVNVNAAAVKYLGHQVIKNEGLTDVVIDVAAAVNGNAAAVETFGNQAIDNKRLIDVDVAAAVNLNAAAVTNLHNQASNTKGQINVAPVADEQLIDAAVGNGDSELDDQQDSRDTRISDLEGKIAEHLNDQLRIRDGRISDLEQRMSHAMCNRDWQPSVDTWRCTSPRFMPLNEDYAEHYAGSTLNYNEWEDGEIEDMQNLEGGESFDGSQKQKTTKEDVVKTRIKGGQRKVELRMKLLTSHILGVLPRIQEEEIYVLPIANAGLRNSGVICYSNVIFQCIASCSYLTGFLQSQTNEEH